MEVKLGGKKRLRDLDTPDREGVADTKRLWGTVLVRFWPT